MPNRVFFGVVASKAATIITVPTQRAIGSGPNLGFTLPELATPASTDSSSMLFQENAAAD